MATIKIKDLDENIEMNKDELRKIIGGSAFSGMPGKIGMQCQENLQQSKKYTYGGTSYRKAAH